ncbi:hypothetical protein LOTGIDRAFT_151989 [Lottia gigantea]|uniref:Uncharacterized protein n=1 Tax=Lottia gigantea TaxID=225164 RepID=V4B414_LOTGI|nr:hypothetical protein LOTGIDRAFT_151989 [Lottia gigantea]ESP05183.1 hypothetical protein LOTGIDRAFT_151989 [Lottia gigantea]
MSILKQLHPDQIFVHYEDFPLSENPAVDWIEDLKRDVAILNFRPMTSAASLCSAQIMDLKMNGIFVESDVIVANLSRAYVISLLGFCQKSKNSCIKNSLFPPSGKLLLKSPTSIELRENVEVLNCQPFKQIDSQIFLPRCVLSDNQFRVGDIQQGDNVFHKSMRTILYGNSESVKPLLSSSTIPLYGHIVSETFTSKVYISILSAVNSGKIKTIFYHGTELPYGTYWNKLKETGAKIHFVEVDSKTFPNTKASLHQYNFYILLQYGGIIFTELVIWQKEIPPDILKFDTVGTVLPFEGDTKLFDLNVLMAKPGALFLRSILAISQQLGSKSNELIVNYASYHIYELYPKYVYMHTNLIRYVNCNIACTVDHKTLTIVDNNSIINDEESYHKILKH